MENGMISCIVILIISSAVVDARYTGEQKHANEESVCESCLKPIEEEEKASSELKPISNRSMLSTIYDNFSATEEVAEDANTKACTVCRTSVEDIFAKLNQPKLKAKVMERLTEYCEEVEDYERDCKKSIRKFAPIVLSKLQQLKTRDYCHLMGFCGEGAMN